MDPKTLVVNDFGQTKNLNDIKILLSNKRFVE
jgi:hypothetical protein